MVTLPGLSGACFGRLGEHPDVIGGGVGGVFELAAFVGDVPDVAVAGVDFVVDWAIGTLCLAAYSMASSRLTMSHSRQGAMTGRWGARAL